MVLKNESKFPKQAAKGISQKYKSAKANERIQGNIQRRCIYIIYLEMTIVRFGQN